MEQWDGGKVSGLLFAYDFVGVSESREQVQGFIRCGTLLLLEVKSEGKSSVMAFCKGFVCRRHL